MRILCIDGELIVLAWLAATDRSSAKAKKATHGHQVQDCLRSTDIATGKCSPSSVQVAVLPEMELPPLDVSSHS